MTAPEQLRERLLEDLRAEFDAIDAALHRDVPRNERERLKQRIIALFKRTDAALNGLHTLKESIRGLVGRYKQIASDDPGSVSPRFGESPPVVHEDHIGASTFMEKGWNLISLGDHAGAIQALLRAVELSPNDLQAQSLLGWAQMLHERYDDALGTFSRVLTKEPTNSLARVNLGYICLKKEIFGEAIEHLSRAIRLNTDRKATLYAHYYLGLVYLERGMYTDAVGFLRQAVALGPNLIEAYHDLGRALWLGGSGDEACEVWRRGIAANPHAPWAERCRDLLARAETGEAMPREREP